MQNWMKNKQFLASFSKEEDLRRFASFHCKQQKGPRVNEVTETWPSRRPSERIVWAVGVLICVKRMSRMDWWDKGAKLLHIFFKQMLIKLCRIKKETIFFYLKRFKHLLMCIRSINSVYWIYKQKNSRNNTVCGSSRRTVLRLPRTSYSLLSVGRAPQAACERREMWHHC